MDNAYCTYSVLRLIYPKVISAIIKGKESDTKTQPQQVHQCIDQQTTGTKEVIG